MIVVSTHLDDAVWSAAGLCEGSTVVTICAGVPDERMAASMFDVASGFGTAKEAMLQRRLEDRRAATLLSATPLHWDVMDGCYGRESGAVAEAVGAVLSNVGRQPVAGPLGIGHPDHREVAAAFLRIVDAKQLDAMVYADLPYAMMAEHRGEYVEKLQTLGLTQTIGRHVPEGKKRAAVEAYASQIRPGTHLKEILGLEMYARL